MKHKHKLANGCRCRCDASEPNWKCPIHSGFVENRCIICGQFISWRKVRNLLKNIFRAEEISNERPS